MKRIEVPRYAELSIKQIWPEIKKNVMILSYLPDYEDYEFPEREFLFGIMNTLYPQGVEKMIKVARDARAYKNLEPDDEKIVFITEIANEIESLLQRPSKTL